MDIDKLSSIIVACDNVIITPHKSVDFDALGSALGMYYIAIGMGKDAHIIIEDDKLSHEVNRCIDELINIEGVQICKYSNIKNKITNKSVLVIVDTNISSRVQNSHLLDIKNVVLIDHHAGECDVDTNYCWSSTSSSSAVEMVLQLINGLNVYVPAFAATIMLAGLYIDTNGFIIRTSEMTHYCASMLYKFGVDIKAVQQLLKQDYDEFKRREELVLNTEFIDDIAISSGNKIYTNVDLAKVCDELMTFDNVLVAFVIGKLDDNIVGISARSLGSIDVSLLMSKFGGGGHENEAACQIKNKTVKEVKEELISYLGGV